MAEPSLATLRDLAAQQEYFSPWLGWLIVAVIVVGVGAKALEAWRRTRP